MITCPNTNCNVKLDASSFQSVLPINVFEKWCRALCESVVVLDSSKGGLAYGRSYCPYQNCSELILNECVNNSHGSKITKSSCPSCKKLFCFQCMVPWKEKHQCIISNGEIVIDIDSINDDLFVKIGKQRRWRRCPSCHYYVERTQGCKNITCRCKTVFCYNCGRSLCICYNRQQQQQQQQEQRRWYEWISILVCSTIGLLCLFLVTYIVRGIGAGCWDLKIFDVYCGKTY
ncbi:hypothetical protein MKW94_025794 [Papaver nudicaule]|uniref:RBR-type E3 ubiquitin transferase n=1 Tax=Papaver nudicaule TaxID=74823 RepID=A0AA42B4C5_PAPNU|nr:hypothetical protein [Papaver nudicaule]